MASTESTTALKSLSFEAALKELETIVRKLETGESDLEQAITDYTRGTALKVHCERKLKDARLKVEKIVQGAGGDIKTEAFEDNG